MIFAAASGTGSYIDERASSVNSKYLTLPSRSIFNLSRRPLVISSICLIIDRNSLCWFGYFSSRHSRNSSMVGWYSPIKRRVICSCCCCMNMLSRSVDNVISYFQKLFTGSWYFSRAHKAIGIPPNTRPAMTSAMASMYAPDGVSRISWELKRRKVDI